MKNELQAGLNPPPQPKQESRIAQHFSHTRHTIHTLSANIRTKLTKPNRYEQKLPSMLAETASVATERFRTNYDALLRAIQRELADTMFVVPDNPHAHNVDPITVAIASGNSIKNEEMERLLTPHEVLIHRVPEAEEEHSLNITIDAMSKATDAVRHIHESHDDKRRAIRQQPFLTIANDVLNAVPVIARNEATGLNEVKFKRMGKPNNLKHEDGSTYSLGEQLESVRQTFHAMAELAATHGWERIPLLSEIATVIHNPQDPKTDAISTQRSSFFLSPEIVSYLATPEGFAEYLYRLGQQQRDIRKIASGIEFRTITDMMREKGLMPYSTGTASDITKHAFAPQREEAERHALRIALGHADERLIAAYFGNKPPQEE